MDNDQYDHLVELFKLLVEEAAESIEEDESEHPVVRIFVSYELDDGTLHTFSKELDKDHIQNP